MGVYYTLLEPHFFMTSSRRVCQKIPLVIDQETLSLTAVDQLFGGLAEVLGAFLLGLSCGKFIATFLLRPSSDRFGAHNLSSKVRVTGSLLVVSRLSLLSSASAKSANSSSD